MTQQAQQNSNRSPISKELDATTTVSEGGDLTLEVVARDPITSSYSWSKDATPLRDATKPTLEVVGASQDDGGTYTVMVTAASGESATSQTKLTVVVPTSQPATHAPGGEQQESGAQQPMEWDGVFAAQVLRGSGLVLAVGWVGVALLAMQKLDLVNFIAVSLIALAFTFGVIGGALALIDMRGRSRLVATTRPGCGVLSAAAIVGEQRRRQLAGQVDFAVNAAHLGDLVECALVEMQEKFASRSVRARRCRDPRAPESRACRVARPLPVENASE